MSHSLRFALRSLGRTPGFSLLVVACLALGIGVNVTFMTVLDVLLLRPPAGVREPDQLYRIEARPDTVKGQQIFFGIQLSRGDVDRMRAHPEVFAGVSAIVAHAQDLSLGSGRDAREVNGMFVDDAYFGLVGVRPRLGRLFAPRDVAADAPRTVVLSERLWRAAFGADSGIVGRRVRVNGGDFEVLGVVAAPFAGTGHEPVGMWMPIGMQSLRVVGFSPDFIGDPTARWVDAMARLAPGVTVERAQAVATPILRAAPPAHGRRTNPPRAARIIAVTERFSAMTDGQNPVPTWLLGATAAVLLVACANVANLLLARGEVRRREIATRVALGASRRALVMQLLAESAVLALVGGVMGLAIARFGVRAFALLPQMPPLDGAFDARVILATLAVTALTTLLCGLVPAVQGSRADVATAMRSGTRTTAGRSPWRAALMVGQLAAALALLTTAGVFVRSLQKVNAWNAGIDLEHTAALSVSLEQAGMAPSERAEFARRALERVRALPNVMVAARTGMPAQGGMMFSIVSVEGAELPQIGPPGYQVTSPVGEGWFEAAALPIRRGRAFGPQDMTGAPTTIVSESFAKAVWKGTNPVGKCVRIEPDPCVTVVGVAADAPLSLRDTLALILYTPLRPGDGVEQLNLLVRVRGDVGEATRAIRRLVQGMDTRLPYVTAMAMRDGEFVVQRLAPYRLSATAFSLFGGLSLLVAAIGLYAVVAYSVARRTGEIGVRVALGATGRHVRQLVLGVGVRHALLGCVLGLALGAAATRALRARLYGVEPFDPVTFAVVTLVLLATALLASWLPARRAAAIPPTEALRAE